MSERKMVVRCPKCDDESITAYDWYTPGSYYEPPDGGFEVEQLCSCEFTDEEWWKMEKLLMKLIGLESSIEEGYIDLSMEEADARHNHDYDSPESKAYFERKIEQLESLKNEADRVRKELYEQEVV